MTGKEMARALADFSNGISQTDRVDFVNELVCGTHRTLQQQVMDLFLGAVVTAYAGLNENMYDGRNESTVRLCKKIAAANSTYDRHLPLI